MGEDIAYRIINANLSGVKYCKHISFRFWYQHFILEDRSLRLVEGQPILRINYETPSIRMRRFRNPGLRSDSIFPRSFTKSFDKHSEISFRVSYIAEHPAHYHLSSIPRHYYYFS